MPNAEELETLIGQLWQRKFTNGPKAFASTEFRWLVKFCRDQYCGPGAPSEVAPNEKFDADLQRLELERFFKFVGAPWYEGKYPNPRNAAIAIHAGYTADSIETFTLLPLDLSDGIRHDLPNISASKRRCARLHNKNCALRFWSARHS